MAGPAAELAKAFAEAASKAKVVRPIERQVAAKEAELAAAKAAEAQMQAAPTAAPAPVVTPTPAAVHAADSQATGAVAAAAREAPAVPVPRESAVQPVTPETADAATVAPVTKPAPPAAAAVAPAPQKPIPGLAPVEQMPPAERAQAMGTLDRLSRAQLGDHALDERHMPNFDYIDSPDTLKAVWAQVAEENKVRVNEAQRGVMTWEQSQALADDLGIQPDAVPQVMTRLLGRTANVEDILAARQMLASSADRLQSFAAKHGAGQLTPAETLDFMRQLQLHREMYIQYRGNVTEIARSLNVLRKPVGSDPAMVARMNEMIMQHGGNVEQAAAAIRMANTVQGINKIAQGGLFTRIGKATWNTTNRVFVNGILSGPVTHGVNTMGNFVQLWMNATEYAVAARVGGVFGGADRVQVGEAMAMIHGYMGATEDAIRMAARVARTGETLDHVIKFETGGARTTDILPEINNMPILRKVTNVVDAVVDAPTARLLAAGDEFFKVTAYRGGLQRQVWTETLKGIEAGTVDRTNIDAFVRNLMENPTPEMEKIAEDFAREMTFQNPMGKFGSRLNALVQSVPPMKLIMPFIRTPINIFHESLGKRTPLALLSKRFYQDVAAGGRTRDLALTRLAMGSALAGYIAYLSLQGTVTGNGPMNPAARQALVASGWQPYSLRIWDPVNQVYKYHSYARIEPIASIVGATADAMEIGTYALDADNPLADEDQRMNTILASIVGATMNNTLNKTFMKGLSDFVDMANNPQEQALSWSRQFGGAFLPYSAAWRTVRNIQDPVLRDARTLVDTWANTLPGYSEDLPPKRFLFGEVRTVKHGELLGVMSPIPSTELSNDPVYAEIVRLMRETNMAPVTMPQRQIEGLRLTPQEYDDYVRISRAEPLSTGMTLQQTMQKVTDSPQYQRLTPESMADVLHKLQLGADEYARIQLEKTNPQFAERIAQYRALKNQLKRGY